MGQAQTSMPMFTCSHGAETLQRPSCSSFHPRRACPQEKKATVRKTCTRFLARLWSSEASSLYCCPASAEPVCRSFDPRDQPGGCL